MSFQPSTYDINLYRGDTFGFVIKFKDSTGPIDIDQTFTSVAFNIFRYGQAPDEAMQPVLHGNADVLTGTLTPEQSKLIAQAVNYYELKVHFGSEVKTLLNGRVYVGDVRSVGTPVGPDIELNINTETFEVDINSLASSAMAVQAANDAEAARDQTQQIADQALIDITDARDTGVQAVQDAEASAIGDITQATTAGVNAVGGAQTTGVQAVQNAEAAAVSSVNSTRDTALEQVGILVTQAETAQSGATAQAGIATTQAGNALAEANRAKSEADRAEFNADRIAGTVAIVNTGEEFVELVAVHPAVLQSGTVVLNGESISIIDIIQ
jgi:hypothetical protein